MPLVQSLEQELLASARQLETYAETVRRQWYNGEQTNGYHYMIEAARLQRQASRALEGVKPPAPHESFLDKVIRWFGCGQ